MMSKYGPRPHEVYSDRDKDGIARIAVAKPQKGKSLKILAGRDRDIAFPFLSHIYFDHTGKRFKFEEKNLANERLTISEDTAIQMMLLMDAVSSEEDYHKATNMAQAISAMNTCEASWWYAHHNLRHRPRKVLQALELMYV